MSRSATKNLTKTYIDGIMIIIIISDAKTDETKRKVVIKSRDRRKMKKIYINDKDGNISDTDEINSYVQN